MSTRSILKESYEVWKRNWLVELSTFFIIAAVSLLVILPLAFGIAILSENTTSFLFWMIAFLLGYVVFLHISIIVGLIHTIDDMAEEEDKLTITTSLKTIWSKIIPLMGVALFYLAVVTIPSFLISYFLLENYLGNIILEIMYGVLYFLFMIIFGVPWFFSIGRIMIIDDDPLSSIIHSWKIFYQKFDEIFPTSAIAVVPVVLFGSILLVLGLTLPEGNLIFLWIFLMVLDLMVLAFIVMPWSLNITYPLYKTSEEQV